MAYKEKGLTSATPSKGPDYVRAVFIRSSRQVKRTFFKLLQIFWKEISDTGSGIL
jgi:hypothetical protein